jgi:hypothetical protein
MMKLLSRWRNLCTGANAPRKQSYESLLWLESEDFPGVEFSLRRVSLSQRIELLSRIRELTLRNEFLKTGPLTDQLEASIADLLVKKLYLEWAVVDLKGLKIDGQAASVAMLIGQGPEALVSEIADAIRAHLELADSERKNS